MIYTIKEAKEEIKNGIRGYLLKDEEGNYLNRKENCIPFYLEGKPGIGKTEIVRQIAKELGIGFVSFSITHHTRNSLLGLPIITELENERYTKYTMSEIIAAVLERVKENETEGILLLDEFNCASETVMPTMLSFLQTRNIGQHELPKGWSIVLCGNPKEYNKSARSFDPAILDRVRKLSIESNLKDFLEYASEIKLHSVICDFLAAYGQHFYRCETEENDTQVVTARSWENLSHALTAYEKLSQKVDSKMIYQYIKSEEVTIAFYKYYWMCQQSMQKSDIQEILMGKNIEKHIQSANEKGDKYQWNLGEILLKDLEKCVKDQERNAVVSKKLDNAFLFLKGLSESALVLDKFFFDINASKELLSVLAKVKNEEYLKYCRKAYGEMIGTC